MLDEQTTCLLNGDLLSAGHAFTLHHGDRLFVGAERLLLVCLWRQPEHEEGLGARSEAQSHMRRAEAELLDATGLRLGEMHRLRRAGQMIRSMWRRAAGSLFTPVGGPELRRMDTSMEVAAAAPVYSPSARSSSEAAGSPSPGLGGYGSAGGASAERRADGPSPRLLLSGSVIASHYAASRSSPPRPPPPLAAVDMVDAATSARPLQEAAMLQQLQASAELQRREGDADALRTQLELLRAEAAEVAEENQSVREALDESRMRLSDMAEELAATRAALRAREQMYEHLEQRRRPAPIGSLVANSVLGCVGGRENNLRSANLRKAHRSYAVNLVPTEPNATATPGDSPPKLLPPSATSSATPSPTRMREPLPAAAPTLISSQRCIDIAGPSASQERPQQQQQKRASRHRHTAGADEPQHGPTGLPRRRHARSHK